MMDAMSSQINFHLVAGMVGIYVVSIAVTSWQTWAATSSDEYRKYRLREPGHDPLAEVNKSKRTFLMVIYIACMWTVYLTQGYGWLIKEEATGFAAASAQVIAILLVYDFMFYWIHRGFHTPFLMKHVHYVHHKVRFPTAVDDYYLHPVDTFWVTTIFLLSVAFIGPLSTNTFLATLFVWVFINNILHSGLNWPHPVLRPINFLARMHDVHHGPSPRSNFGSIFPFWDMMFGTYYRSKGDPV